MIPWDDVRFALRSLRKSPGFTSVAVLTIALGLGANTAIFSFLDGVLLKPLQYPEPEQLVQLWEKPPGGLRNGISALNFLDWQKQATSFTGMAAQTGKSVTQTGAGEPRQIRISLVSAPFFEILGVRPVLGRTFVAGEDQRGSDKVVVLTQRLWRTSFGGDPALVGKDVVLDGEKHTVIGVLPAGEFDRRFADAFMPLSFPPDAVRNFHYMGAIARLKPGVSLERAQSEMSAIAARIAEQYPDIKKGWGATVDRWIDRIVGPQLKLSLQVLMAAVAVVLLIGCANLANLLLARGTLRSRELAVRTALGASRAVLIRQLLVESLILSVAGGALGLLLGFAMFRGIRALLPPFYLPAQADIGVDLRVTLFLAALTLLTGALFGLVPAVQNSRRDPVDSLKEGGRGNAGSRRRLFLRNSLVVSQVALAFVLLAGAGLLIRSFQRLTDVDPGFDSANVVTMSFPLVMERDTDGARLTSYVNETLATVRAVPGVREAAMASALPMQGWGFGMPFRVEGESVDPAKRRGCGFKIVTPGYFGTLGMKLRKGRALAESDVKGGLPVAVVNETFASRYLAAGDPIGRHVLVEEIITGKRELGPEIPWQVVGVVADEKAGSLDSTSAGMYVSYAQSPIVGVSLVARGAGEPMSLGRSVQTAIWQGNKNQALPDVKTLEAIKSESTGATRLRTSLLAAFSGLALLLAAIGIYGVLSYVTAQRTQELGVRAALGASKADLVKLVVRGGAVPVAAGLALGGYGALALTRFLQTLLFETNATDPLTLLAVSGGLVSVALLACWLPARRAARVDPMIALRAE
jgi:putative ABC transport system permease protein